MTKQKKPEDGPIHGGGSVVLDPKTGRLTPNLDDDAMAGRQRIATEPAPEAAAADVAPAPTEETR